MVGVSLSTKRKRQTCPLKGLLEPTKNREGDSLSPPNKTYKSNFPDLGRGLLPKGIFVGLLFSMAADKVRTSEFSEVAINGFFKYRDQDTTGFWVFLAPKDLTLSKQQLDLPMMRTRNVAPTLKGKY